ncbi:hypothetical protein EBR21_13985 [bacterium]|nr:hypothetical protein [bacterium]
MEKIRTFSRGAGLTALVVAGLSLALGHVLADDRPIPRPIPLPNQPGRPPILIDPSKLPVIRHSYIIKTLPVQVNKPIQSRLPSVPLPQLRPETQVTIGLLIVLGDVHAIASVGINTKIFIPQRTRVAT